MPAIVALACLLVLQIASSNIGLTWDESTYLNYAGSIVSWLKNGADLDSNRILQTFGFNDYLNPHPPLMKWCGAFALWAGSEWMGGLQAFRLGHHLVISLFVALIFRSARMHLGTGWTLGLLGCAFLQPRVLGQLSLGTSDGVVAVAFFASAISLFGALVRGELRGGERVLLWLAIVAGMAAKVTGALVLFPLLAGVMMVGKRRDFVVNALGAAMVGLLLVVVLQPHLWGRPFAAMADYLLYPIRRSGTVPISVYYLGENHASHVPWHYPVRMLGSVLPDWLFLCGMIGVPGFRRIGPGGKSFLVFLGFWVLLLALPSTPKHDEIRQFLAVCPILGGAAFLGFRSTLLQSDRKWMRLLGASGLAVAVGATAVHALPWPTMFYNRLSGGMGGNESAGNDLCLYFEPLNAGALSDMNVLLPKNAKLQIAPDWAVLLWAHQILGDLRRDIWIFVPDSDFTFVPRADYILKFRRRSLIQDVDFFLPAPVAVRRYFEGVEVMRLVKSDSTYRELFLRLHPHQLPAMDAREKARYSRWTGNTFESVGGE